MAYAITHRNSHEPNYHRLSLHIISSRIEQRNQKTPANNPQFASIQPLPPKSISGTHPMSHSCGPARPLKSSENVHDHISLRLRYILHLVRIVSLLNLLERLAGVEAGILEEKNKSDTLSSRTHKTKEKKAKTKYIHHLRYCNTWGNNPSHCMYQEPLSRPCSCLQRYIELVYNNQVSQCYIEERMERNIHWKDIAELTCSPLTTGTNSPSPLTMSPPACCTDMQQDLNLPLGHV